MAIPIDSRDHPSFQNAGGNAAGEPNATEEPGAPRLEAPARTPLTASLDQWLPHLLRANDSFFPTGSYAHSFGLETVAHRGWVRDIGTLGEFLEHSVVPSLRRFDLPFVRHAFAAAAAGNIPLLCEIDQRYGAMRPARELRVACAKLGRQRLALLRSIFPSPPKLLELLDACRQEGRVKPYAPIAVAADGVVFQTPLDAVLISYYYQTLLAMLSASLKLIRIGQTAVQGLLTRFLADSRDVIEEAKTVPLEEAGWFSPHLDIASSQHETAFARLFIS